MVFRDRRAAGIRLATQLEPLRDARPVVVALPRGGVPVGFEVAQALHAPLDVLAVRKLGAPLWPELAVGAVAEEDVGILDPQMAARTGMTQADLERVLDWESEELRRRVRAYRDGRPPVPLAGRTVIVVDDGLATGLSDLAAVRALRRRGARRIVVASPVGSSEAIALLREEADRVVCATVPPQLDGVGRWYEDFSEVTDAEVVALLAAAHRGDGATHGRERNVAFGLGDERLAGDLSVPAGAGGLVLFAHGSGSSRLSPRNRAVAQALNDAGFATLLFDLLTEREGARRASWSSTSRCWPSRLLAATRWAREAARARRLPLGYFGASTGAAAALSRGSRSPRRRWAPSCRAAAGPTSPASGSRR